MEERVIVTEAGKSLVREREEDLDDGQIVL